MAFWVRLRKGISLFWRWFTHWRKRYWALRLALLLVVFAQPVYEVFRPVIRDLVVIAIQGIDCGNLLPRYESRLLIMREAKGMQRKLLARFDANRDGRLSPSEGKSLTRTTGLAPSELTQSTLHARLDRLVTASQRAGLLSPSVTGRQLRHRAWLTAQANAERYYREYKAEQAPLLALPRPGWRDYLHWRTWAKGGQWFLAELLYTAGLVTSVEWGPVRWLLFVILPAVLLSVYRFRRHEHLSRRFAEDPEFALAPCPRCHAPTRDFRALRAHRFAAALTAGVAAGLFVLAVLVVGAQLEWWRAWWWRSSDPFEFVFSPSLPFLPALLAALVVAAVRWVLWPREVHAGHTRPHARVVGRLLSVVLAGLPAVALLLLVRSAFA